MHTFDDRGIIWAIARGVIASKSCLPKKLSSSDGLFWADGIEESEIPANFKIATRFFPSEIIKKKRKRIY